MASPCPRCGATKTESVAHGFIYDIFWSMGYHLRRCSACNRRRLFKRGHRIRQRHHMTDDELQRMPYQESMGALREPSTASETPGGNLASDSTGDSSGPGAYPNVSSNRAAVATGEVDDYHLCPMCGSTLYRRSRRRWYERLAKRPKMARCLKCDRRFPYPR